MQARHLYGGGGEIHLTAGADKTVGDIELAGGIPGVIVGSGPIKSGDRYTVYTKGVFAVITASATTFSAGAEIEWDDTTNLCVAAAGGTFNLGRAVNAKTNGQTETVVNLNEVTP